MVREADVALLMTASGSQINLTDSISYENFFSPL